MDEFNWDPDTDEEFEEPTNIDAFYLALKFALQQQAHIAAEMESAGQFGIGQ